MSLAGALPPGPWWLLGAGAAPALAAGALRMARRGPIDHASVPIVLPLSMIAVPTGWLVWGLSGLDLAAPGCAVLLRALIDPPAGLYRLAGWQALVGGLVLAGYLLHARRRYRSGTVRRPLRHDPPESDPTRRG
jgi:hypothetical protein